MGNNKKCAIVGAGAIGKSVAGYIFTGLGYEVLFVDVDENVVKDLNKRKGYNTLNVFSSLGDIEKYNVKGISAISLSDQKTINLVMDADYICLAIGPAGVRNFLPELKKWLQLKPVRKELFLVLFENDLSLKDEILNYLKEEYCLPEYLHVLSTSIERMSKVSKEGEHFNVSCEEFFPVFISENSSIIEGTAFAEKKYFTQVDNLQAYYYRKLFTNNLGHAILGYVGKYFNCETSTQAINIEKVFNILEHALDEATKAIGNEFNFSPQEMKKHKDSLLLRLGNKGMDDDLNRLARDPERKLRPNERIVGPLLLCKKHKIESPYIIDTLTYAVNYLMKQSIHQNYKSVDYILENVCKIKPDTEEYKAIKTQYNKNFEK